MNRQTADEMLQQIESAKKLYEVKLDDGDGNYIIGKAHAFDEKDAADTLFRVYSPDFHTLVSVTELS